MAVVVVQLSFQQHHQAIEYCIHVADTFFVESFLILPAPAGEAQAVFFDDKFLIFLQRIKGLSMYRSDAPGLLLWFAVK